MRKWKLILFSCILSSVLLFPIPSLAVQELKLNIQPYEGYDIYDLHRNRDLVAGEAFVIDLLYFNEISSMGSDYTPFFNPAVWDFTLYYDSGITPNIQVGQGFLPGLSYTIEQGNKVNVSTPDFNQTATYPYGNHYTPVVNSDYGWGWYVDYGHYEILAHFIFNTINPGTYYFGISNADPNEGIWGIFYTPYPFGTYDYREIAEFPYFYVNVIGSSTPSAVPEPTTMLLLGLGLLGLAGVRRKMQ